MNQAGQSRLPVDYAEAQTCILLGIGGGLETAKNIFNWIYHGRNRKQCYYQPNCLVCKIRFLLKVLMLYTRFQWEKWRNKP